MMFFTLPKPLPENDTVFSWLIVGIFSTWGGIVRYLIENRASKKKISWAAFLSQIVISGFTGLLAGIFGYEKGYGQFMTIVFSGLGGVLGVCLLDFVLKRFSSFAEKEGNAK